MQLNDLKEQVFGFYESERAAWRLLGGYAAVPQARDLGVIHMAAGRGRGDRTEILASLARSAARFGMIPGTQCFRAKMVAAVAYGKIMYGIEVNHLTEGVLQKLRKLLLGAIGGSLKYGDVRVAALDFHQGKWEPAIVMARRIFQCWMKEGEMLGVTQSFWNKAGESTVQGPVGRLREFCRKHEIDDHSPFVWRIQGSDVSLLKDHNVLGILVERVRESLWRRISENKRMYAGMASGRDEENTMRAIGSMKGKQAFQLAVVRRGAVLTPVKQHLKWGRPHDCPLCGKPQADWMRDRRLPRSVWRCLRP
jgi:hypothetical protein